MANMSSSVLLTVDPGVHQTSIQRHLEESFHSSQGRRHCAVQDKPIYKHDLSAARITQLLWRTNGDIYGAQIQYRREVGGRLMSVNRHLQHLYPFMEVETTAPQEIITSLQDNGVAGTTAPGPSAAAAETQDEFSNTKQ